MTVNRDPRPASVGLTTAAARTLLAPLEESGGRADLIARRLGAAIRVGLVLDGERLPAEFELATQLGVSTVTLREALAILREQGLVTTRRGRGGGSFAKAPADMGEPLQRLSVQELRDLGDQRRAISGTAAKLAAERAMSEELRRLDEQVQRLRVSRSPSERRRAHTEFTIAVAAAAQSPRLTHEEARLRSETGDLLGLELDELDHDELVQDRERLMEAIAGGDGELARDLAEQQVVAETERLIRLRLLLPDAPGNAAHEPGAPDEPLGDVAVEIASVFAGLDELGARFGGLAGGKHLVRDDLEPLRRGIFALLDAHGTLVSGAGIVTAPGLLVDAPRWLEWWWTTSRGAPEALRVNLDPAAPDFYDYTSADWYATPERTREPRMAGPYVDYACTNEYAITLSVPVLVAGDMAGVAAADVLVASLEPRVLPALAAVDRPVALTSGDGRVIASTSAAHVPGQLLAPDPEATRPASSRPAVRSWLLVDL